MDWVLYPQNVSNGVCPQSACSHLDCNYTPCYSYDPCPNDTSFCVIESGGPTCTERSCGVFFG